MQYSDIAFLLIIPTILSFILYISATGYWNDVIKERFVKGNAKGINEILDLIICYSVFAIIMQLCIYIILKFEKGLGSNFTDGQAQIASLIVLMLLFISRISSALEKDDPLKPINLFIETAVIIIFINFIISADKILLDLSKITENYFYFFNDFLNFWSTATLNISIGIMGLILIGEIMIKFIIKYYK
jgi:hypothetical protein